MLYKANDLMLGQSYLVNTVLEQYDAINKMFLAFKDGPRNPLYRLPTVQKSNLFVPPDLKAPAPTRPTPPPPPK